MADQPCLSQQEPNSRLASLNPVTTPAAANGLSLEKRVQLTLVDTIRPAIEFYNEPFHLTYGPQIIGSPIDDGVVHILYDWSQGMPFACIISTILYLQVQIFNAGQEGPYRELYLYQPAFHVFKILTRFDRESNCTKVDLKAHLEKLYEACYTSVLVHQLETRWHAETLLAMFFFKSIQVTVTEREKRQICTVKWWQIVEQNPTVKVYFTNGTDKHIPLENIIKNNDPEVDFPILTPGKVTQQVISWSSARCSD
jgi:hypothetical protein